jgi:long-subunit acyl-CoA synthetase (AMP-forming)
MKIVDLLTNSATYQLQSIAIKGDETEIFYRQMLSDVNCLSEQLKSLGCSSGVTVAIVLHNSAEYLISFFAISAAGGIILPLSTRMTPYEVARYVGRADASIIITNHRYGKRLFSKLSGSNRTTVIYVRC